MNLDLMGKLRIQQLQQLLELSKQQRSMDAYLNGMIIPTHARPLLFPRGSDYTFTSSLALGLVDRRFAAPVRFAHGDSKLGLTRAGVLPGFRNSFFPTPSLPFRVSRYRVLAPTSSTFFSGT